MDNGLSHLVVNAFYKDSKGFMWIGTDNGLNRFDGVSIAKYYYSTTEIVKNRITAITEWQNELFLATDFGLMKLNNETHSLDFVVHDAINIAVSSLVVDNGNQILYVGTKNGLCILNSNRVVEKIQLDRNVLSAGNVITSMTLGTNGSLWLATKKGLFAYNIKTKKIRNYEFIVENTDVNIFSKITRIGNTIILGTFNAGLVTFDISTKKFSKFMEVGFDYVNDLSSDNKDIIYVSGNGIRFISLKNKTIIKTLNYVSRNNSVIRTNSVYSFLKDKDGIIWIGYYMLGFDYSLFQRDIFKCYSLLPNFDSKDLYVRIFLIRGKEKLIGTREGLYYINEEKRLVRKFGQEQLRSNTIISLCQYKGEYYIGTYGGGLSVLNPITGVIRTLCKDWLLQKGHVFYCKEDSQGTLWIGTSGGVYKYSKDKNELILYNSHNSQLKEGCVYFVFFDSSKKGWLATESGLSIIDPATQQIRSDAFPSDFSNNQMFRSIYEDSDHTLYFCPGRGNIITCDLNITKFSPNEMTAQIQNRMYSFALQDSKKRFWYGSDNGLLLVNKKDDYIHNFGFIDGVPDRIFGTDAAYEDGDGRLWFGNSKGLIYADPSSIINVKQKKCPVIISNLQINGENLSETKQKLIDEKAKIDCKYNENNFRFGFVSLTYSDPEKMVYEYKLEGYDSTWNQIIGKNEISYSELKTGDYVLHVRIQDDPSTEVTLEIIIHSYFTILIFVIAVVILVFLYQFWKWSKRYLKRHDIEILTQFWNDKNKEKDAERKKSNIPSFSEQECDEILDKVRNYLETDKPYTNPDFKMADFSYAINCPTQTLSYVLNHYLKKSYSDFINEYRVEAFKHMVLNSDFSRFTILSLAEKCGFGSEAAFFRIFKKVTGMTPSEYVKSVQR